ncbi:MAG: hypothetical protein IKD74_05020 [Clostridia bacterium]|nr:hypothetical protein [Clostridia bacterium]
MIGFVMHFIDVILATILLLISSFFSQVEINEDILKYNQYIGQEAIEPYRVKSSMDEKIFPESITDNMKVEDYKMVYYNPWDAQYLSYLVVNYDESDYEAEVSRLKSYDSTDYIGYYGVTGFSKYELLAMSANDYNGFIYALTDGKGKIIYVELIFCNYYYDLDYSKYINVDYLPDGFDATVDNNYRKEKLGED